MNALTLQQILQQLRSLDNRRRLNQLNPMPQNQNSQLSQQQNIPSNTHRNSTTNYIRLNDFQDSNVKRNLKQNLFPKPLRCTSFNKEWIILSTPAPTYNNRNGVYIYDISCCIWRLFCKYPRQLRLKNHNHTLDINNNLLYIFGGQYNTFSVLDLKQKTWKYKLSKHVHFPLIPTLGYSAKYDKKLNTFIDAKRVSIDGLYKFITHKAENQLIAMTVISFKNKKKKRDSIENTGNKWFKNAINTVFTKKNERKSKHIVLVYGYIVIFYCVAKIDNVHDFHNVYCMDLLYRKSHTIRKRVDVNNSNKFIKKCRDGLIYMNWMIESSLIQWSLDEVIPNEWKAFYKQNYDHLLVFGYVRNTIYIPVCIYTLIFAFYPGYLAYTVTQ